MALTKISLADAQKLIDNKEWDKLSKTDFIAEILAGMSVPPLQLSKDFLYDFLLNETYLSITINNPSYWIPTDRILQNVVNLITYPNANVISEDDYINFIHDCVNFAKNVKNNLPISGWPHIFATAKGHKSAFHLNAITKIPTDEFAKLMRTIYKPSFFRSELTSDSLKGVRPDTLKNLKYYFTYYDNQKMVFTTVDPYELKEIFNDSIEEMFDWSLENIDNPHVPIMSLKLEDFNELVDNVDLEDLNKWKAPSALLSYYNDKYGPIANEKLLKYIRNRVEEGNNSLYFRIVSNMSEKQIQEHKSTMPRDDLARSRYGLPILKEQHGDMVFDLSHSRMFTLDEMKQYPNFINPKSLARTKYSPCTPEVFKVLKKAWDMPRARYNKSLMDFNEIMTSMSIRDKDMTNFAYIVRLLKPSKEDIFKQLEKFANHASYPLYEKSKTITSLMK